MSRARAVCFTLNNYSEEEVKHIEELIKSSEYGVYQRERGKNGTAHIQGYVYSKSQRTLAAWKRVIGPRAHIEFAKGSAAQNRTYCTKEETREPGTDYFEHGSMPRQGERTDLEAVAAAVAAGESDQEIAQKFPGDVIRYHRGIQYLRGLYEVPRRWKTRVFWWYGPTGTGKSFEANQRFPEAYWKMGCNRWWDGYRGDAAVIIDDYRRDLCTFAELLRLLDQYPYRVEFKGGSCQFAARDLVITTPLHPRDTWAGRTEEDIQQLLRRIDEVRYFGADGDGPIAAGVNLSEQLSGQKRVNEEETFSLLEEEVHDIIEL